MEGTAHSREGAVSPDARPPKEGARLADLCGRFSPHPTPAKELRLARPPRRSSPSARSSWKGPHDPRSWLSRKSGVSPAKSWTPAWSRDAKDVTVPHSCTET